MVGARSRKGISAPLVGVFATVALVICLSFYALVVAKFIEVFYAASGAVSLIASEAKKRVDVMIALRQVVEDNVVKNYSMIIVKNNWPDKVYLEMIMVLDKSGNIVREKSFVGSPILLTPGQSIQLRFADISQDLSAYDADFWRVKREVGAIVVYASGGTSSFSYYSTYEPIDINLCRIVVDLIGEDPVVKFECP